MSAGAAREAFVLIGLAIVIVCFTKVGWLSGIPASMPGGLNQNLTIDETSNARSQAIVESMAAEIANEPAAETSAQEGVLDVHPQKIRAVRKKMEALMQLPPQRQASTVDQSHLPRVAFGILVEKGESLLAIRLLLALFHPSHHFLLLTDDEKEEGALRAAVNGSEALRDRWNIAVVGGGWSVVNGGSSSLAAVLRLAHAALRHHDDGMMMMEWDWFIHLRADDYPLTTPDDLRYLLSHVPRDHTILDLHVDDPIRYHQTRVMMDSTLFSTKRGVSVAARRGRRNANLFSEFTFFIGSSRVILSRPFLHFLLFQPVSWPRRVLMYLSTFTAAEQMYFHTLACMPLTQAHTHTHTGAGAGAGAHTARQRDREAAVHPVLNLTVTVDATDVSRWSLNASRVSPSGPRLFLTNTRRNAALADTVDREILHRQEGCISRGAWLRQAVQKTEQDGSLASIVCGGERADCFELSSTAPMLLTKLRESVENNGGCESHQ